MFRPFSMRLVRFALALAALVPQLLWAQGSASPSAEKPLSELPIQTFGEALMGPYRAEAAKWRVGTPENSRNNFPKSQTKLVRISGAAELPGTYQFPKSHQALLSAAAAGGPSQTGSYRRIRVRKPSGAEVEFDLYPFLLKGDFRGDVELQGGEEIIFLPAGPKVFVLNGVSQPAKFEFKTGETILDAIGFAGGPKQLVPPIQVRVTGTSALRPPLLLEYEKLALSEKLNAPLEPGDRIDLESGIQPKPAPKVFGWDYFAEARKAATARQNLLTKPEIAAAQMPLPTAGMDRYQLGPGDLLTIRVWSPTVEPKEFQERVDASGSISVPVSGRRRVVRGQTLLQIESQLATEIKQYLRNAKVTVSIAELRSISVSVLGEAFAPGTFTIPATATLFDVLLLAGGPSERGSLRSIQLRRANLPARNFDVYGFLLSGKATENISLQPGDTIFVPPTGARVHVEGEVARPGVFELAVGEKFWDAMGFAGGMKGQASHNRISLESVEGGISRKLVDVQVYGIGPSADPYLSDGDVITVMPLRPQFTNEIRIEGAVNQPGRYAWNERMRITDLVRQASGLLSEAHRARADLWRANPNDSFTLIPVALEKVLAGDYEGDILLQPNDRLVIHHRKDVEWLADRKVEIIGAVRKPGTYTRAEGMKVSDLLMQAGGPVASASLKTIFLQRFEPNGTPGALLKLDGHRIALNDPAHDLALRDRDTLTLYTDGQASFQVEASIQILGAVQRPGVYPRSANMTLADAIALAGGLLPNASPDAEITASYSSTENATRSVKSDGAGVPLQNGDLITIPTRSDYRERPATVTILGAIAKPGPYAVRGDDMRISELISRSGGLTTKAFPAGTQFLRRPDRLRSDAQKALFPRMLEVVGLVNESEYRRAMAVADFEKLKALKTASESSTSVSVPGLTPPSTEPEQQSNPDVVKAVLDRETVSPARPLTDADLIPAGNIAVHLLAALKSPKGSEDLSLEDGDIIIIPEAPTSVSVVGAVVVPSSVIFQAGKSVQYYVDRSGGLTQDAATQGLILIKANGAVMKAKLNSKVELGDLIFVPTGVMSVKLGKQQSALEQASKVLSNGAITWAIIRAILR